MEFFTDTGPWDSLHRNQHVPDQHTDPHGLDHHSLDQHGMNQHGIDQHGIDQDGIDQQTIDQHSIDPEIHLELFDDLQEKLPTEHHHDENRQESRHPDHPEITEPISDQYFSPALSFQGTPLMSPHALAPQTVHRRMSYANHTPQGTPHGTPQLVARQGVAAYSPSSNSAAGSVTDYGMYYAPKVRNPSSKVTKQSPAMKWRSGSFPEDDEFQLGDPALDISGTTSSTSDVPSFQHTEAPNPSEDLESKLRDAIAATARANSRSNSVSSTKSGSSRRASTASSNRTTPRIRPKLSSQSTDPSPLIRPYDGASDTSMQSSDELFMKSNYQNLLDGTHQHLGLSSADRMATDLRSKKAVHKYAEQERRNRMNVAITELSQTIGPEEDKSLASKAATVERAAKYIRQLQQRVAELESQLSGGKSEKQGAEKKSPGNSVSPLS